MFDYLGRTIDKEQGLKSLSMKCFEDKNKLEEWPLEQLALKCHHLESLKMDSPWTTRANSSQLLEFAGQAVANSSCLHLLHIVATNTSASDGDRFM